MIDILFVVLFFLFIPIVSFLLKYLGIKINKVSISSVLLGFIFVFCYIGLLPLYFGLDEYRYYGEGIQDRRLVMKMFLYTSLSVFGLVFGFWYSKEILKMRVYSEYKIDYDISNRGILVLILLLMFSLGVLYLYTLKVPNLSIFLAISGNISEATLSRSSMGNDFAGKYHWYNLIIHYLLNTLTYIFFSIYLGLKKKRFLFLFLFSLIFSIFSAVMSIEKGPLVMLFIGLFFTYSLSRLKGNMPIKSLVKISSFLIVLLIIMYMSFMGSDNVTSALSSLFSRAFTGGIGDSYFYLQMFPNVEDYLLGRSFPNPGGIMPFTPYNLTTEVKNFATPELSSKGIVGSAPTMFWAELYANFGVLGICIGSFIIGVLVCLMDYLLSKLKKTPITIGFTVWVILHYKNLSNTGISGYLFDFYLVGISFFITLILILSNNFKIKYYKIKEV